MDFLNAKISTLAGLLILLAITSAVGVFIIYQVKEVTEFRIKAMESYSGLN